MGAIERKALMTTFEVQHKRLGHPSSKKISNLSFTKNISRNSQVEVFDVCFKAKNTRLPFLISEIKTTACFDLIYCDVWGKYITPSFSKAQCLLTIVDDFSWPVWTFLLKHKHAASTHLMNFHKMIKTQFGKEIKRIRCDNRGELFSNRMHDFYAREWIILETSFPYTPQQKGVVERKHRHLLEWHVFYVSKQTF